MRVDVRSDEDSYKRVTAFESKGMPGILMSGRAGETDAGYGPEGSTPLAAKMRFCRINLAWSKLRHSQHPRKGWGRNLPRMTLKHSLDTLSPHDI